MNGSQQSASAKCDAIFQSHFCLKEGRHSDIAKVDSSNFSLKLYADIIL